MLKAYLEQLVDYNYWANGLILKYAERLDRATFTDVPLNDKLTTRDTLCHVMFAEWILLDRMREQSMPVDEMRNVFSTKNYPDIDTLYKDWFDLELRVRGFLAELPEEQFLQEVVYIRSNGAEFSDKIADLVTQMVFHGMQHRSECAVFLTKQGHSPGNIDYITYLRP